MKVQFKYAGQSRIVSGLSQSHVAFATNELREAAYFRGTLGRPLLLRDALSALHTLVVSDLKYRPRDREEFTRWLAEQDRKFLQGLTAKNDSVRSKIDKLEARLSELDEARRAIRAPYYQARKDYFEYAYTREYELEYVLDPVITIHPDELSFEAFSQDESSYGRVAVKYDLFSSIDAFECGTTNIDFSVQLNRQLERMRSYRETRFDISPSGFSVLNSIDGSHHEKQIELPDSWVNGFLQVQSTMTLGLTRLRLSPIDFYNICRYLSRFRAKKSPRALRWELRPGKPTRVVFEPWEHEFELSPTTIYQGDAPQTIRTWGRDRLKLLARLFPQLEGVDVYLAGHGLPTIYVCDLGDLTFTLGLSGWTEQDWTGTARFDLLTRRLDAEPEELTKVYTELRTIRLASSDTLATITGLGVEKVRSCLSTLCQVGRAMYDLSEEVYRHRDLFFTPFSAAAELAKAQTLAEEANPQGKAARLIFEAGQARFTARRPTKAGYKLSGSVRGSDNERVRPLLSVNREGKIVTATCTCKFFRTHKLTQGPCEHMLALRLAHMSRLEQEDAKGESSPE